jgi:hypothetical protein
MTVMTTGQPGLLGIYLNDHLAGATGGVELARRSAAAQRPGPTRDVLRRLADEIAEDRKALMEIMAALGVPARKYKVLTGWVGEKAGRLKPNGHLLSRSPLSELEELEIMMLGVQGKAAGWRTLRSLATGDTRLDTGRLDGLLARAHRQVEELEGLHASTASQVLRSKAGHAAGQSAG